MPEEPLAVSTFSSPAGSEDHYEALHAAIAGSAHGRWFLQEYARRQRATDTRVLLAAIGRLEAFLSTQATGEPPPRFYPQLLEMAKAITEARAELAAGADAFTSSTHREDRAQQLASLLAHLEGRITWLLEAAADVPAASADEARGNEADEPEGVMPTAEQPLAGEPLRHLDRTEAEAEYGFQNWRSELEGAASDADRKPSAAPTEVLPSAANALASEAGAQSEPLELEFEPLHVQPLFTTEI